jgi:RND family efflux transporter MFP subunit
MRSLILFSSLVVLAGCGHESAQKRTEAKPGAAVTVQAVDAVEQERPIVYEATGTVRASASATISSKLPAYVQQVHAAIGDQVRAGQRLVTLDAREAESGIRRVEAAHTELKSAMSEADNGIAAAKAQLDLANATFKRMSELAGKKSISRQEFDEASARHQSARASYEMARSKRTQLDARLAQLEEERRTAALMREYTDISAPFAGVVASRSVEPGNLATPGTPLFSIERAGAFRLEASVDEKRVPEIRAGQAVEVTLEALGKTFPARVAEIVPMGDSAARSYTVKIDLPGSPQLRSGMFGRARWSFGSRKALVLPAGAVQERGQLQTVFVIEDGHARSRIVTVAAGNEVLSGLAAGEKVISPVPPALYDGAKVEVRP